MPAEANDADGWQPPAKRAKGGEKGEAPPLALSKPMAAGLVGGGINRLPGKSAGKSLLPVPKRPPSAAQWPEEAELDAGLPPPPPKQQLVPKQPKGPPPPGAGIQNKASGPPGNPAVPGGCAKSSMPLSSKAGLAVPPVPQMRQLAESGPPPWPQPPWQQEQWQEEEDWKSWEDRRKEQEERRVRLQQEAREREQARKLELEASALQLHGELAPLLDKAEVKVKISKALAGSLDGKLVRTDDEVIKACDEWEVSLSTARGALKACSDFMNGKYLRLQGSEESTKQDAAMFLKRLKTAEREAETVATRVRARKKEAVASREKENKRLAAVRAAERQEVLFKQYDADGDGLLSAKEVGAFVKGECNFDLPQEKVESILKSEAFAGSEGVSKDKFPQLRLLVGVAAVVGALAGMEAEVTKAEEKAKPLTQRGRMGMPLDVLEERTDEVDTAVDGARDYLAAAREQVLGLDIDAAAGTHQTPAVRMAMAEARKLGTRLDWFDQRLARAAAASKASRDRLNMRQ